VFIGPGEVYILDARGEIVHWNAEEVAEDEEAFTAALTAVALAAREGPEAVRDNITSKGERLSELIEATLLGLNPKDRR
jgi:hypothetical protein